MATAMTEGLRRMTRLVRAPKVSLWLRAFCLRLIKHKLQQPLQVSHLGRRLSQRWPDLPILYISAYEMNDIFRRGSPRQSAPFLQKPFPMDGLVTTVRGLIQRRSHAT